MHAVDGCKLLTFSQRSIYFSCYTLYIFFKLKDAFVLSKHIVTIINSKTNQLYHTSFQRLPFVRSEFISSSSTSVFCNCALCVSDLQVNDNIQYRFWKLWNFLKNYSCYKVQAILIYYWYFFLFLISGKFLV